MNIERTIDLKDLLRTIIFKWRLILLWMVLGAVVMSGFGILRKYRAISSISNPIDEVADMADQDAVQRAALSELEAEEVDWAVSVYETYTQKYKSLQSYTKDSIYMNIDPYHVATMQLDYYIQVKSDEEASELLENVRRNDIRVAYMNRLQDENIYAKIIDETDGNLPESSIRELISYDAVSAEMGSNNLSINVIADTRDNVEKISGYVQAAVENITLELQKVYGDFSIKPYNITYAERVDSTIATQQQAQLNALITLKNSMTSLKNGFSEDQKTYYEMRIKSLADEATEVETGAEALGESESEEASTGDPVSFSLKNAISLKYILVGAILGAVCVFLWYAVRYIMVGKLHVKSEMEEYYKVPVLGCWRCDLGYKRLSSIDKAIFSLFGYNGIPDNELQMQLICENIKLFIEKDGLRKIFISSAYQDDVVNQTVEQMKELLKNDIGAIGCGSVNSDPNAIKEMAYSDAVILVESVDKSYYDDIQREVERCNVAKIPIIGCVVLE